ncbi:hypothetical protein Tco_1391463 [Tanacetum coccineum]
MASLDYRFNLIKECSSCGALYTKSCGCSKGGFVDKFVRNPNKTLTPLNGDPPQNYPKCGNPVDGLYCRQCALLRKKLEEVWFTICDENEILNTSELSNDITNVVNVPQEPFEPVDSLIMEDEHLDTIPATKLDEFIKSSAENLVPTPSESEDASDDECDLPVCDDFPKSHLVTFSNPLFDIDDDVHKKYHFNSIPPGIDSFYAESNLIESLLNRNTSIDSSSKIDSLLDEFADELTLLKSIPPGIDDDNLYSEGEIHLVERLLYDNSSPCPPKELNVENSIESFSPSPIPVEDSDSLMEEIDVLLASDGSIPPGIESDDYDSEGDDNFTSLPEFESFHGDYPDLGDSTIDVVEDIPVDVPNILPTHPTLHMDFDFIPSHNDLGSDLDVSSPSGDRNKIYDPGICIKVESTRFLANHSPMIDTLLPFSSENKDKVFNYGVLASKEKSPSSSHRGFKASKIFQKSLMLIHGENNPNLGVSPFLSSLTTQDCLDFEASRTRGFCPSFTRASHPQLHYGNPIP